MKVKHTTDPNEFWDTPADAYCVTTNLVVSNGRNVMGAGVAKQAAERYPDIPERYGSLLEAMSSHDFGPREHVVTFGFDPALVMFPTKRHYGNASPLPLVVRSCVQLLSAAETYEWGSVSLPAPGCGYGGLSWKQDVEPILSRILDDRFTVWHLSRP